MNFIISDEALQLMVQHIENANKVKNPYTSGRVSYQMSEEEAGSFYDMVYFKPNDEFLDMVFIIANSIRADVYDEGLNIGSFRCFLEYNHERLWDKIITFARINKNFLQFVLYSWPENFEEEKYAQFEKMFESFPQ